MHRQDHDPAEQDEQGVGAVFEGFHAVLLQKSADGMNKHFSEAISVPFW
jgi:hypothetical protein